MCRRASLSLCGGTATHSLSMALIALSDGYDERRHPEAVSDLGGNSEDGHCAVSEKRGWKEVASFPF